MGRSAVLQEIRLMRFDDVYGRYQGGQLTCEEAADLLSLSVSTFYRSRHRFEAEGAAGLYDLRLGKASARRAPADEVAKVLELFDTRYFDFRPKHFHEKLAGHGIGRSYGWAKTLLQSTGRVAKAKRRGAHRRKRERKPLVGMMVHQDGSRHAWVPGVEWDLIVTLDDATSEIYSAFFVEEEGTMSSFQGIGAVIARHGLFCALYADRGAHYWRTGTAGDKVDRDHPTQVKRALDQLGIELIAAYSPEARGRSERMFGTLQMRLPQELRLAAITDMAAANRFLAEVYLPAHNRRFASAPTDTGSAFVRYRGADLADILCLQEERVVGNDNTVRYNGLTLQIPPDRHRHHYVKARVRVHELPDGHLAVFHGPRCLARYDNQGDPAAQIRKTAA